MVDEARRLKGGFGGGEIGAPHQQIDIARIADRILVDPGNPLRDGVPADDGVRHPGVVERVDRPAQSLLDLFGCHKGPLPPNGC